MHRHHLFILSLTVALFLTACGKNTQNSEVQSQPDTEIRALLPDTGSNPSVVPSNIAQNEPDSVVPSDNVQNAELNDVVPSDIAQNTEKDSADPSENAQNTESEPSADVQNQFNINSHDPLSPEQLQKLSAITWDVDPEVLNAVEQKNEGGHFPFSDEKHLDLFKEHIENLGGTYIGVGTDQGYLFIGWQKPTLAFVIDYDPWVVLIHRIYMAFWNQCENSECLYQYFNDRDLGMNFMKSETGTAAELNKQLPLKVYKTTQRSIARQLGRLKRMSAKNFMNDDETFQFIKKMIQNGRIRTLQANLLGDRAFQSISETLNELGASVTTLYLSNAEQYWGYSQQFKKNIIGIPASDNALILRTSATYPNNNDYRYSIQPISVFKAWLQHPDGKSVKAVTNRVRVKDPEDFPFVIDDFLPPTTEE